MANKQILGRFIQTPSENKQYTADYTNWLATSETVATINSFTISPTTSPALAVGTSAIDPTGKLITFFVSGGTDGSVYQIIIQITTSTGQVKQDEILITVATLTT